MSKPGKVQRRAASPSVSAGSGGVSGPAEADFTQPPAEMPAAYSDGILWVPSERVHLARINLPLARSAGRLKALPFAFEPLLGQPLEEMHVALGPEIGGADYVAAAISRQTMQTYADRAGKAARLVPDVFLLPVPPSGAWNAGEIDGRILVRTPDGAGFAASNRAFAAFHEAAGRPECRLMFGSPDGLPAMTRLGPETWPAQPAWLDLRQGTFAAGRQVEAARPVAQAQIAAAVLVLFTVALGAEAWTVSAAADRMSARLSASLAEKFPDAPEGADPAETIESISASFTQTNADGMIAVLSLASGAFDSIGGMALQRADFSAGEARLDLSLEAGSVEALYEYVSRLETEGLLASVANVEAIPGGAEGLVSISAGGGSP